MCKEFVSTVKKNSRQEQLKPNIALTNATAGIIKKKLEELKFQKVMKKRVKKFHLN